MTPETQSNDLVIQPKSRMQALMYALGVSGYGLREILAKTPIEISRNRIVRCTKVPWFWRSYFVLEFQTDMLCQVTLWELPTGASVHFKETTTIRFYREWVLRDWRKGIKTLAATFYLLGMIPVALGMLYYAQSHALPQGEYRRNLHLLLSVYSVAFPILFYQFARPSMRRANDLRSLQIQTACVLGLAMFLIVRTVTLFLH